MRQHVLLRPGMYVGAVEQDACVAWVMDDIIRDCIAGRRCCDQKTGCFIEGRHSQRRDYL